MKYVFEGVFPNVTTSLVCTNIPCSGSYNGNKQLVPVSLE